MKKDLRHDVLWIVSEICYYFGLILAALVIPLLTLALWMMDLAGKFESNYWYLLIAWVVAVFLFLIGVLVKNRI